MINFGNVDASSVLYIPFITLTGLAVTYIEIYKHGSVTQRSSDAGYALLDTDGIDFDGITGIHGFSVDLSDNTDAGFYSAGGQYWVVVSAVTVDTQTVNFIAATFRIGYDGLNVIQAAGTAWGSGAITAASIAGDAITAAKLAADVTTELQTGLATASALSTVAGYIDTEITTLTTNLATVAGYLDTEVAAILAAVDTEVAAIKAKTDQLTFTTPNQVDSNAIGGTGMDAAETRAALGLASANLDTQLGAIPTNAELTTAINAGWTTILTESYAINGAAGTPAQILYGIQQWQQMFAIVDDEKIVKKLDGSTTAFIGTFNSAITPSASTRS
jgi:hypothetical protein